MKKLLYALLLSMISGIFGMELIQNNLAKIGLCRPQSVSFNAHHKNEETHVIIRQFARLDGANSMFMESYKINSLVQSIEFSLKGEFSNIHKVSLNKSAIDQAQCMFANRYEEDLILQLSPKIAIPCSFVIYPKQVKQIGIYFEALEQLKKYNQDQFINICDIGNIPALSDYQVSSSKKGWLFPSFELACGHNTDRFDPVPVPAPMLIALANASNHFCIVGTFKKLDHSTETVKIPSEKLQEAMNSLTRLQRFGIYLQSSLKLQMAVGLNCILLSYLVYRSLIAQ